MHIPDGLMAPALLVVGWIVSILALALATRKVSGRVDDRHVPFMAVLAGGIFVAQMLNFPIGGGTTGHLVGGALVAIFLGPYAGMLVIATILILQCLFFGDGGLTSMGLNMMNMAVVMVLVGWYVHRLTPERYSRAGLFLAAWLSVFLGSIMCALELSLSHSLTGGAYGITGSIAFPSMILSHALIGIGEAIITVGVISYIEQVSPSMLRLPKVLGTPSSQEVSINA